MLDAGSHRMERCEIRDSVTTGVRVADGASVRIERTSMTGQSDAGLVVAGTADVENTLIDNGVDGVRLASTGSVGLLFTTIADNTGVGLDNSQGGAYAVDRSIVYGNTAGDILPSDAGTACTPVTWSDTAVPDCSGGGDNMSGDPLFDLGYGLQNGSPCLDHGPDPALFTGEPPTDLDGGPRLADDDGDGMARSDPGAFERINASLVPGETPGLSWDSDILMVWDAEPEAAEYHVYRDLLSNLSLASFGQCRDGQDADRTDTQWIDLDEPAPGQAFFYLVTADTGSEEGSLGFATSAERSNFGTCVP
jgi:hypothetical protein